MLVGVGAYAGWRRRRSSPERSAHDAAIDDQVAEESVEGPATLEDLRSAAAAALVATDDAIRSSQLELAVARTEVGDDGVEPFTAALDLAREQLGHAFATLRHAQEGVDTDAERSLLEEVLAECAAIDSRLDDLAPRFDALRDLEARAAEALAHLTSTLRTLEDRLAGSAAIAEALRTQYPRATIVSALDDLDQATERLRFAGAAVTTGGQLLDSGDRAGAAACARAAEEALAQASTLLNSVDRSPKVLARAEDAVTTMLAQTERDIAEAERLGVTDDLAARGRYARETLGWAGEEIASGGYDPLEMRRALQDTDLALGRALGPIRSDDDTQERANSLLATCWYGARATVRAADELLMTRRGAVGVEARARLWEARSRYLEGTALGESDPTTALRHLRTADTLAYQSRTLAQQDEAAWRNVRRMGAGPDPLDAMRLGGILIEPPTGPSGASRAASGVPAQSSLGPPSFGGPSTRGRRVGHAHFPGS